MPIFDPKACRLEVGGLVAQAAQLHLRRAARAAARPPDLDFHCVTGWTVDDVRWSGVRFEHLLDLVEPLPEREGDPLRLARGALQRLAHARAGAAARRDARPRHGRQAALAPARLARARRDPGDVRLQGRQVADADRARRPPADRLLGRPRLRPERVGRAAPMATARPDAGSTAGRAPSARCTGCMPPPSASCSASGLCLYLPSLAEAVSRRPLLKSIHLYTAVAWAVALVARRRRSATAARCGARCARSTASTPTTARGSAAAAAAGPAERGPEAEHDRHRRVRDPVRGHRLLPLVRRARHALPARRTRCSCTTG